MFDSVMDTSIMRIAQEKGALEFIAHDLRNWTHDVHRTTDDYPFGGGAGLVMKPEPIFEAYDSIASVGNAPYTVFLAPVGKPFTDAIATQMAQQSRLLFICGHYEGIDERVYSLANEIVSLGDYVLSSGELAAMVVIDAVVRKLPGVLGNEASAVDESFTSGLLEYPQYTRPATFRNMEVPSVLLSGNHAEIEKWRRQTSLERTARLRPDLLEGAKLSPEDMAFLEKLS